MKIIAITPLGRFESEDQPITEADKEGAIKAIRQEAIAGQSLTLKHKGGVFIIPPGSMRDTIIEVVW